MFQLNRIARVRRLSTRNFINGAERTSSENLMRKWVEIGDAPQVVADVVVRAATDKKPKLRYSAGKLSTQTRMLRRFMPEWFVDRAFRKFNEFAAEILRDNC